MVAGVVAMAGNLLLGRRRPALRVVALLPLLYFLFLAPGILLALWAQYRVKSTYAEASEIPAESRMSSPSQNAISASGSSSSSRAARRSALRCSSTC